MLFTQINSNTAGSRGGSVASADVWRVAEVGVVGVESVPGLREDTNNKMEK